MPHSEYESSEEEDNESSEEEHPPDQYYEEVQGEYDYEEYEHDDEGLFYVHSPRNSTRTRSSRSSQRNSMGSSDRRFFLKNLRKSMGIGLAHGHGHDSFVFEEEIQHNDNQDLLDALPEDIASLLIDFWQQMEDLYDPMAEKYLEGIHKSHKKLSSYPGNFQEEFLKQLEAPDERANIADIFKADFNRVPIHIRTNDEVKSVLYKRIGEFLVKVEGVTEDTYANAKRNAYKILSKSCTTTESEKMARLFGDVLQAETDRFADTMKFINEHYYTTIANDLAMPNKVKWKEILDLGLIKKKFLCEHFREQCLIEEMEEQEDGECTENKTSSDSDICGGGMRGQELALICGNADDSTSTEEETTDESLFRKYGEEEEMDFGESETKMNGEMKMFDSEEFLGEGDWEAYTARQNSAASTGAARDDEASSGDLQVKDSRGSQSNINSSMGGKNGMKVDGSTTLKPSEGGKQLAGSKAVSQSGTQLGVSQAVSQSDPRSKKSKINDADVSKAKIDKENKTNKKNNSQSTAASVGVSKRQSKEKEGKGSNDDGDGNEEEASKNPSHFDFPEEYDEELEMEPEAEVQSPDYFEDEYPGEFWEGEGYGSLRISKSTHRDSSVKFDDKETYIRDFFWDSDPSKQDATDMSKTGNEKEECADEGYFDEEEVYDDEDVCYDRDEFFEREGGNNNDPEDFHFAIFGKQSDVDANNQISLLNKLLLRWSRKERKVLKNGRSKIVMKNSSYLDEGKELDDEDDEEEAIEEDDDAGGKSRVLTVNSSSKLFSPSTPASAIIKPVDSNIKVDSIHSMMPLQSLRSSFFDLSGGTIGLLKLSPDRMAEVNEGKSRTDVTTKGMLQQRRPLLECFVNLQDEIWNGFEIAFVEARTNIEKLAASLKEVVARAYPLEEPKDPCEEETDLNELIARGEAIIEKYRINEKRAERMSKAQKHVHMKESVDEEEDDAETVDERESSTGEQEEDNEEEENNEGSQKSSVVELVSLHPSKQELLVEASEITTTAQPSPEKRSSLTDSEQRLLKKEQMSSNEGDNSDKKKSMLVHHEESVSAGGSNSNQEKHQNVTEQESGTAEEEKETEKRHSATESVINATTGTEKGSPLEEVNSPRSEIRAESTVDKSAALERTTGDIDIRLQESAMEPSPEEKKILKRARHALLKLKLQNWEKALELEKERLNRQLAIIEAHAQHEFHLLKELPIKVWESSKSQAANVYMDDLKRDAELGDVFKTATQNGSPLYGKFHIDRRDLMLLLKDNEIPIPMKYTEEYEEFANSIRGKKSKKFDYFPAEE